MVSTPHWGDQLPQHCCSYVIAFNFVLGVLFLSTVYDLSRFALTQRYNVGVMASTHFAGRYTEKKRSLSDLPEATQYLVVSPSTNTSCSVL